MSLLGPANFPALGLAASAAGSQRRAPVLTDQDSVDQAQQKLDADRARLANRDLDDSVETDFSHGQISDRDSDGRLPWRRPKAREGDDQSSEEDTQKSRPPDADRGQSLDVDV